MRTPLPTRSAHYEAASSAQEWQDSQLGPFPETFVGLDSEVLFHLHNLSAAVHESNPQPNHLIRATVPGLGLAEVALPHLADEQPKPEIKNIVADKMLRNVFIMPRRGRTNASASATDVARPRSLQ